MRCYCHIGTGNYNEKTARLYEDVGLFTCDPEITSDVVQLFHYLTGRAVAPKFDRLLVAPWNMRERFIGLIQREVAHHKAGRPARIVAKMNQLQDVQICEALVAASREGLPIDLVIRGFCCLRPGVPGQTETIRIRSIIGRFLEHSRIFYFANGASDPRNGDFYIGSGDWMERNLSWRVEVVAPVVAPALRQRLWEILDINLNDRRQAWIMTSSGEYQRLEPEPEAHGPARRWHSAHFDASKGDSGTYQRWQRVVQELPITEARTHWISRIRGTRPPWLMPLWRESKRDREWHTSS